MDLEAWTFSQIIYRHFIDQHPSVFAAIFPIYFCLWLLVSRDHQLRWRLVLAGEGLSHTDAVQWGEMENAERTDAVAGELQPRADD